MEMPATESRVHGGEGIFENVNTISSSECSGDLATYVKHFMKSPGKIEAISPGHGFKNGDLPESDDENMDRAAPRFVGVDLHGDGIRIAATADLHSNQLRQYIDVENSDGLKRVSLQDPGSIPEDTELLLIAGDLGVSFNEELSTNNGAYEDRRSHVENPRDTEARHLARWGCLLAAVVERHPKLHVVFIAGNHDSLLCSQGTGCVSCTFPPVRDARKRWPLATELPLSPRSSTSPRAPTPSSSLPHRPQSSALAELFASIPSHHHPRVHYLDHEYVDIDLNAEYDPTPNDAELSAAKHAPSSASSPEVPHLGQVPQPDTINADAPAHPLLPPPFRRRVVRVFGSAWTPQYHGGLNQHFTYPARSGNEDHTCFWQAKWRALEAAADTTDPWILMTHGPPLNRLDTIKKGTMGVGDRFLMTQLSSMASGLNPPGVPTVTTSYGHTPASSTAAAADATPTTTSTIVADASTTAANASTPSSSSSCSSFEETAPEAKTTTSPFPRGNLSLRRNRAPVLHVFGHVHAQQYEEELPTGPRFCADGTTGVLFLNCAAERKLPSLSSAALSGQERRKQKREKSSSRASWYKAHPKPKVRKINSTSLHHQENVASTSRKTASSKVDGPEQDGLMNLDDDGNVFEAMPAPSDPRDLKEWLRPPALIRVPRQGRLVQMQRYGKRKF